MTRGRKHTFKQHEIFYIQAHALKMSVEEIAEELEIGNTDQVRELVEAARKNLLPTALDQMVKKDKRAVAMTESASQLGDEARKQHPSETIKPYMHVINENR